MSAIFLGLAYVGVIVLVFLPVALIIYLKDKSNDQEMSEFYRARAKEFVLKYEGRRVEYYYMEGTCLVDFNKTIQTKLLGMTKDYFVLADGFKLPLNKYIHPVD